jgi:hypothetical protein
MIPGKTNIQWRNLLTGKIKHEFKLFSAGMCVNRNIRDVEKSNYNEDVIQNSIHEVYTFFCKYENILTDDIKVLFK